MATGALKNSRHLRRLTVLVTVAGVALSASAMSVAGADEPGPAADPPASAGDAPPGWRTFDSYEEAVAAGPSRTLEEAAAVQQNSMNVAEPTVLPADLDVPLRDEVATFDDVPYDDEDLVDPEMPLPTPGVYTFDSCRADFPDGRERPLYKNRYASCLEARVPYRHFRCSGSACVQTGTTWFTFTQIGFGHRNGTWINFQYQLTDFDPQGDAPQSNEMSIGIVCDAQGQATCPPDPGPVEKPLSEWDAMEGFTNVGITLDDSPPSGDPSYRPEDDVSLHSARTVIQGDPQHGAYTNETTFRCDNAQYLSPRGACIFDDVQSVHYVDLLDNSILEEALHIYAAYHNPDTTYPRVPDKHVPGDQSADRAKQLTRMAPRYEPTRYRLNHDTAVRTCTENFRGYPGDGRDCDEFPYRSTYEGAYWKVDHPDDYFSSSAAAINRAHNQRAGRLLGAWYLADRILHRDRFWVKVGCGPFAEGCGGSEPPGLPGDNVPPTVDAGPDVTGAEGSPVTLAGTVTDPDDTPTIAWSAAPGPGVDPGATCTFANAAAPNTTITCTDDGPFTVTLTADDGHGEPSPVSDRATVTLANVNPAAQITAPTSGQMINARRPAPVSVTFTDQGTNDTHTCQVDYGDGDGPVQGTVTQQPGGGTCAAEHVYGFDGLGPRTITATITDDDGGADSKTVDVVVYVPGAGFAISADGLLDVERTPDVRCPPDDEQSTATLDTLVGRVGALNVSCTVSTTTGRTEVETSVADVTLLNGLVRITDIQSTCTADASGIERSSLVGTINGIPIGAGSGSLSVLGLAEVAYNESTTDTEGRLVQNAIRVRAAGQEVVVGSCRLG